MPAPKPKEVDAVIIGAGLVGMFTALFLYRRGFKKIVVVDKGHVGGIASPRAGGLLRRHYHIPLLVELATLGEEIYATFSTTFGCDIGYTKRGYLLVVDQRQQEYLEKNVDMQQQLGVDVELLSSDAIQEQFPEFRNLGRETVAAYERSCSYVDPPTVCRALSSILRTCGVILVEGSKVDHIDITNGHVCGVSTPTASWRTHCVVNCAGAWGGEVARLVGINLPVEVKRLLQIIELSSATSTDTLRILSNDTLDLYARPGGKASVLIGGRVPYPAPQRADDTTLISNEEKASYLKDAYQNVLNSVLGQTTNGWASIDGDTPDYQPIIGPLADAEGMFIATGFSGHGFKLAPIIGKLMSEFIVDRRCSMPSISLLNHRRFTTGELLPLGYKQMGS